MTRMLDEAYFRPGSDNYTRNNGTYGLTTLRSKHLDFDGNKAVFSYVGKSSKEQVREITNSNILSVLKRLDNMPGYKLFDITNDKGERQELDSSDLNSYISSVMGEDFSAKDFRTWAGTLLMALALEKIGPTKSQKEIDSNIIQAVKNVAEGLGNTPAVAKESYVHPDVITQYQSGTTLGYFKRQLKNYKSEHMSLDERAALELLLSAVKEKA